MMIRIAFAALLGAAPVACASGHAQGDDAQLVWSSDTLLAIPELARDLTLASPGADPVVRPTSVRASSGLLLIADVATDRVAVLDSSADLVRWIGARGRGPGELYGVSHIAVRGERFFVGEALNGRVSEFTVAGRFVRTYSSPFAAGAIGVTEQHAYSAARSHTHYASLLVSDADPAPVLHRVRERTRAGGAGPASLPGHDLLASDSANTWVFDQAAAKICRYGEPRARGHCALLPDDLRARLAQYRNGRVAAIESATRLHVESAPLAKDMLRVGTWLALLLPLPELPIVLVGVDDGTLTPVMLSATALPRWARRARSFAWDGRGFVLVSDEGIGRLYISRRP